MVSPYALYMSVPVKKTYDMTLGARAIGIQRACACRNNSLDLRLEPKPFGAGV